MAKDFEKMTDAELAHFILSFPDNFTIPGALFEQQRRDARRAAEIERTRHQQILRWTVVAAIAAIVAAVAALWAIFH
jgi:hypothetical protein